MKFPENMQESMYLFRHRLAEYLRGVCPLGEMGNIILTHAGTCDVGEIFAELPPDLQDYVLERSLAAEVPRDQLFTVALFCTSYGPPRPPTDPQVLAANKRERERQDELHYRGICKFYEFFKKTGKLNPGNGS
jgi:hypothetical protein